MNLIFDFDGTICDSIDDAFVVINQFLKQNNLKQIAMADFKAGGLKGLVERKILPTEKIPSYVSFGVAEIGKYIPHQKTYPGIHKVLKLLSKKHLLAITTGNSKSNVEMFLENNDLTSVFKEINSDPGLFGKTDKIKEIISKYDLKPNETYYIGDESRDIDAAKGAGVKSIAVTWGLETKNLLSKRNPDLILENPKDLLTLV